VPDSIDPTDPPDVPDLPETSPVAADAALRPLDVAGVRAVAVGTVLFTVAFAVCVLLRVPLAEQGRAWWTWVCAAGALLGLAGLVFVRRRASTYAAASH
jgi:MYXO-CTERM domain-containing protein